MQLIKAHKLVCAEVLMTAALIVFIALCVRGRVRDDVSLDELRGPVLEQLAGAENMKEAGAVKLRSLYDLDANEYEEVLLYIPVSNMDAQEMLLVRCRSEEQADAVAAAMKKRIQDQTGIFESYGVEQMALIRKAVVDVQGTYCLYVCDLNSYAAQSAFRKQLAR